MSLEVDLLRYAFLRYLQIEGGCSCVPGKPCDPKTCGCEREMQLRLDEARNALATAPVTPGTRGGIEMTEHTPGPWVQFAIDGQLDAIMPAGRDGDVCTFLQPPSEADARLMTLAPTLFKALGDLYEFCKDLNDFRPDGRLGRDVRAVLRDVGGPQGG